MPAFLDGKLEDIRRYCETDVMNTYLLYCRFQKMRGGLTEAEYEQEIALVKADAGQPGAARAALAGIPRRLGAERAGLRQFRHDRRS